MIRLLSVDFMDPEELEIAWRLTALAMPKKLIQNLASPKGNLFFYVVLIMAQYG